MKAKPKATKSATATKKRYGGFTEGEKSAMADRVREMKLGDEQGEIDLLAKIAEMTPSDRAMAKRVHEVIKAAAPALSPKTWYGMPAYAKNDKVVCFFQPAQKFKSRYATLGFNDPAHLDDGAMWPVAYALTKLTATEEAKVRALVKKAAS